MSAKHGLRFETMESAFVSNEDPSLFVQLAQAYRDAGDFDRAIRILRRGIEQHPTHGAGYELLGLTLLERGRVAEAAFCFERLIAIDPDNPTAHDALEEISRRLRDAPLTHFTMPDAPPVDTAPLFIWATAPARPASFQPPPLWPHGPPDRPAKEMPETEEETVTEILESEPALDFDSPEGGTSWQSEPDSPFNGGSPEHVASVEPSGQEVSAATLQATVPLDTSEILVLEPSMMVIPPPRLEQASPAGLRHPAVVALSDLLVGLLEYRDPFFRGSASLTKLLATAIGRDLKLPESDVNALGLGALLRDLGQFPLRNSMNQPGKELSPGGRKDMEQHVETALDMLTGISLPALTHEAIRHHHERWDGFGYPDGLAGDAIPLSGRILAVADSFSAMISARPHRLPRRVPAALEEIRAAAGVHYDPQVVDALIRVVNAMHWKGPGFSLRHHVLIVEPDVTKALVSATRLCSHGYLAEATFNVAAAQERLGKSDIVALIISSDLPGEEEERLLRQVRETARIARIPVIMTNASVSERVTLLEAGADVCLDRSASFAELRATLEAFLRREGRSTPHGDSNHTDSWSRLRGDIVDFPLNWLLQVLHYDSRTAAIFLAGDRDEGVIYLDRGTPRHAQTRQHTGDDALRAMLNWKTGSFNVDPDARTDQKTIRLTLMNLLLDTALEKDHTGFFGQVQP
jgi:HD-GYP domain-containing protein (c-di-GMP phosphodiesterase class II)/DNA-binding response OmpR family regulator